MVKFLLLTLIGILLYLALTRAKRPPPEQRPEPPADETMVRCAYCGVHLPIGESLSGGDKRYCCEEHRRLGQ